MHLGYLAPTLVFGGAAALGFFLAQRRARKVKFFQQEELEVYLEAKGKSRVLGYGELRANETTLQPGEKIFVLGTVVEEPGRYTLRKGQAPFVLSDTDSGQIAYAENNKMYVTRFWSGASALAAAWWLWHLVR